MDLWGFAIPAGIYLGMPLLVKFSQKVEAQPQIESIDPSQWPPVVAQTMSRVEHDLYNLGFTITARYQMVGAVSSTSTILTMLVNYQSGDKAMITAVWGQANGVWNLGTHYTEFSTRFADGHCFDTMNSATLSSFARGPKDIKTQVPQIKEAAELWSLHRFVMRKHDAQGEKLVYDIAHVRAYFGRIWRESFEEQVGFGRYNFNGKQFVPSFKGAYLMCWGIMWPMSAIRQAQLKSKSAAIVSEWKAGAMTPSPTSQNASPFSNSPQGETPLRASATEENRILIVPET